MESKIQNCIPFLLKGFTSFIRIFEMDQLVVHYELKRAESNYRVSR